MSPLPHNQLSAPPTREGPEQQVCSGATCTGDGQRESVMWLHKMDLLAKYVKKVNTKYIAEELQHERNESEINK